MPRVVEGGCVVVVSAGVVNVSVAVGTGKGYEVVVVSSPRHACEIGKATVLVLYHERDSRQVKRRIVST